MKLNGRLLFNHFLNSGAGSASALYPLVEAQAARRNEGAGSRAEEAKQVFLEAAKRIPADQRQAVLERMEQYNSHEAGGMEVFKAEIEARRVLDSALKEQTQDREHEKTKVKGRGRTD